MAKLRSSTRRRARAPSFRWGPAEPAEGRRGRPGSETGRAAGGRVLLKAAQAEPAAMVETLRHILAHLAPAAAACAAPTAAKAGTAEDEAAVRAVLQDYMDGTYEGDVEKLKACFHPAVNPPPPPPPLPLCLPQTLP